MRLHHGAVPSHLVWAILAMLFCCLPLGIVSIIHALQVDKHRLAGDSDAARTQARKARNWTLAAAISGPVALLIGFLLVGSDIAIQNLTRLLLQATH